MQKKDFKTSYQSVKQSIIIGVFLVVSWLIVDRYYDFIVNFQLKSMGGTVHSAIGMTFLILLFYLAIYILYLLCVFAVDLFYKTSKNSRWYGGLTHDTIRIPLTINQYNKIKDNKIFFTTYEPDGKPSYYSGKLNIWAEKIIEKELKKLK